MAIHRRARNILILRRLIGLTFLVGLATLGLYLFGREGRPEPAAEVREAVDDGEDFAVRGEGFHFALTQGQRTVFEIEGDEQRSDRAGSMFLRNVKIAVERAAGPYRVQASRAFYNPDTHDAVLEGNVIVGGPDHLEVLTELLQLEGEGDQLVARDGARFSSAGRFTGRADRLEVDIGKKIYELEGGVIFDSVRDSEQPYTLRAQKVSFDDERGRFHAAGDVLLDRNGSIVSTRRLDLELDEDTGELSRARLRGKVQGYLTPTAASGAQPVSLHGEELDLDIDPSTGEPSRFELRGRASDLAVVRQSQPTGLLRSLVARIVEAEFANGLLARSNLRGEVNLRDSIPGSNRSARILRAGRGSATFSAAGELLTATMSRNVLVQQQDMTASGEQLDFDFDSGELDLAGSPVKLTHARGGKMNAAMLTYNEKTGLLHGRGGVRTTLEESGGDSTGGISLAGGDGPIRVDSAEAFWTSDAENARFVGAVRAWQGQNTLFADELIAESGNSLSASGAVKTLMVPDEAAETDDDSDEGGPKPQGPIQISGDRMRYLDDEGRLIYEGAVHAQQDGSSLRCETLNLELDEGDRARELLCEVDVTVVDAESGVYLEGYRAIYDLELATVDVFGDPVLMKDATGMSATGARHLIYGFDDKTLRLTSGEKMTDRGAEGDVAEAAQTIDKPPTGVAPQPPLDPRHD